jgi:hypothetical protein
MTSLECIIHATDHSLPRSSSSSSGMGQTRSGTSRPSFTSTVEPDTSTYLFGKERVNQVLECVEVGWEVLESRSDVRSLEWTFCKALLGASRRIRRLKRGRADEDGGVGFQIL